MRFLPLGLTAVLSTLLAVTGAAVPSPTDSAASPSTGMKLAVGHQAAAGPSSGSLSYRARVVHNDRSAISYVAGRIDFGSNSYEEHVSQSYLLDWKKLP